MKLLMATGNPGKVEELRALLRPFGVEAVSLKDLDLPADCPETGETFLENSKQKALYYQRLSGLPVVADDSGLEVDALGGAPGIHSARFGGLDSHAEKRRYLLHLLEGVEPDYRTARFCCAAVFFDGRTYLSAEATLEGFITLAERGDKGFGYDPIFATEREGPTTAELELDLKNRISHRGKAFHQLLTLLQQHSVFEK